MLRMLNAKRAAEFAQTHLDLHPQNISSLEFQPKLEKSSKNVRRNKSAASMGVK